MNTCCKRIRRVWWKLQNTNDSIYLSMSLSQEILWLECVYKAAETTLDLHGVPMLDLSDRAAAMKSVTDSSICNPDILILFYPAGMISTHCLFLISLQGKQKRDTAVSDRGRRHPILLRRLYFFSSSSEMETGVPPYMSPFLPFYGREEGASSSCRHAPGHNGLNFTTNWFLHLPHSDFLRS